MSNTTQCSAQERKAAFEHVFCNQKVGNNNNAGKNYIRPYSKTAKNKAAGVREKPVVQAPVKKKK